MALNFVPLLLAANLLSPAQGTLLVREPGPWSDSWSACSLTDGNPAAGWCNASGKSAPFEFVWQLEQRSRGDAARRRRLAG